MGWPGSHAKATGSIKNISLLTVKGLPDMVAYFLGQQPTFFTNTLDVVFPQFKVLLRPFHPLIILTVITTDGKPHSPGIIYSEVNNKRD